MDQGSSLVRCGTVRRLEPRRTTTVVYYCYYHCYYSRAACRSPDHPPGVALIIASSRIASLVAAGEVGLSALSSHAPALYRSSKTPNSSAPKASSAARYNNNIPFVKQSSHLTSIFTFLRRSSLFPWSGPLEYNTSQRCPPSPQQSLSQRRSPSSSAICCLGLVSTCLR
jgi:hypothetical protein